MNGVPPAPFWAAVAFAAALLLPSVPASSQDEGASLDAARDVRRRANAEGVASQQRIDEISDKTEELFAKYSNALRQIDSIRIYNRQMRELIASQQAELASLAEQVDRVAIVGRSVTPLMLRLIAALEAFIDLDLPFLMDERIKRVGALKELMNRSDVTHAEKYRRIMEAYQIENEYGRTIEAYRSAVTRDGRESQVDFLRFGRIALVYQSLDGTESGVWDPESKSWQTLDSSYRTAVRKGIRIANKQAAPDLIRLPLPAPGGAS